MSAHGRPRRLLGGLIAMLLIACGAAAPAMAAAPTVAIATPTAGAAFAAGQTVAFSGGATEANGDAVPAARLSWSLDSGSNHVRDFAGVGSGSFIWSTSADPVSYSLTLTATGADGTSASDTVQLDPRTVKLTFASDPTGQVIGFNLLQHHAPWTRTVAAGAAIYINAPSWSSSGGEDYVFSSWSDGGSRIHRIVAPTADTTYTATYARPATTTLAGDTTVQSQVDSNPKGTAEAFRTTATSAGTVSALNLYVDSGSNATSMAVALYADASGHPGARLATGTLSAPRAGQWNAVLVSAASVTAGSTYWIAVMGTGTGTLKFRDKPGGGRAETSSQTNLASLPATWSTGTTHSDGPLSATATASNIPTGAFLEVAPTELQFDATSGGAAPAAQTLHVTNRSGSALAFDVSENASWLTVTPTTGGTPKDLTVTVNPNGLAAGTYTTTVHVHAFDSQQGPDPDGFRDIPVTFTVAASTVAPKLSVTPTSLSFTAYTGEGNPANKSLTAENGGGGALSYTTATDQPWLSASPASGSAPGTVTVAIDDSGMAAGTYTGHVTIDAGAVDGSPTIVPVTLTIDTRPSVTLTPDTLNFTAKEGDPNPAAKTVHLDNAGGGTLQYQVDMHSNWITVTPASGTAPQDLSVAVDTTGMAAGSHQGFVIVDTNGGGPTLTVNVDVQPADPKPASLAVTPASLSFHGVSGGASPAAQTLAVANAGDGSLSFAALDDAGWLSASPATGTAPASVSVAVDVTGLAAGTYDGSVTIDGDDAGTKAIAVTLTVDPATTTPPGLVGYWSFDEATGTTAADGSGLGNTGTLNGPVHTAGKVGNGLRFDGVNDWVTVADANSLDLTTQMTLEAWVYPTSGGNSWRTAVLKERTGDLAYALYTSSGNGRPSGHVSTTGDMAANGTATLPLNKWTHLATTYDGATLRLFVNGAQVAAKPVTGAAVTSTGALRFGGNSVWGEWFAGTLDEIRIYKRALTATEIQGDMNRAAT